MTIKNQTVCLLGATGFLGSAIAKELDEREISWVGISSSGSRDQRVKKLNFSNSDEIVDIFCSSDVVINALGSAKPKDFEINPLESINNICENSKLLTGLLKLSGMKKLVHISSAGTVYGEYNGKPHTEECDLLPISWYGKAKVIEELYLEKFCKSNNVDYLCLRVTNPYGNSKKTQHGFIDVLINAVTSGKNFSFYKDCNPVRDFIFSGDMAFSIINLIELENTGIFNLGSGISYSLEELSSYIEKKQRGDVNICRKSSKPDYDVLVNKVDINKLIDSGSARNSIEVFEYIDKVLEKSVN